jgi:hypothetical protein
MRRDLPGFYPSQISIFDAVSDLSIMKAHFVGYFVDGHALSAKL